MIIEFDMPEVDVSSIRRGRTLQLIFQSKGPRDYRDHALLEGLVRLSQHAAIEYASARENTQEYWNTHDTIYMSAIERAASHFESCITNVARATKYFNAIDKDPRVLSKSRHRLVEFKLIGSSSAQKAIRDLRNIIQHQEEKIISGDLTRGETFLLRVDGNELPVEGNTIKRLSWIELGSMRLPISDLVAFISELRRCAEALVDTEYQ